MSFNVPKNDLHTYATRDRISYAARHALYGLKSGFIIIKCCKNQQKTSLIFDTHLQSVEKPLNNALCLLIRHNKDVTAGS